MNHQLFYALNGNAHWESRPIAFLLTWTSTSALKLIAFRICQPFKFSAHTYYLKSRTWLFNCKVLAWLRHFDCTQAQCMHQWIILSLLNIDYDYNYSCASYICEQQDVHRLSASVSQWRCLFCRLDFRSNNFVWLSLHLVLVSNNTVGFHWYKLCGWSVSTESCHAYCMLDVCSHMVVCRALSRDNLGAVHLIHTYTQGSINSKTSQDQLKQFLMAISVNVSNVTPN